MARILGWDVSIPVDAVLLALGFSVAVGVFFGFYPAWKAARLAPSPRCSRIERGRRREQGLLRARALLPEVVHARSRIAPQEQRHRQASADRKFVLVSDELPAAREDRSRTISNHRGSA